MAHAPAYRIGATLIGGLLIHVGTVIGQGFTKLGALIRKINSDYTKVHPDQFDQPASIKTVLSSYLLFCYIFISSSNRLADKIYSRQGTNVRFSVYFKLD